MPPRSDYKFCADLPTYSPREIRRRPIIHRNSNHAPQRAPEKHCCPFSRILTPEHDPIALPNGAAFKLPSETKCPFHDLPVRDFFRAVPATLGIGALLRLCPKMLQEEFGYRFSHDPDRNSPRR
jgi:hypothetical protein